MFKCLIIDDEPIAIRVIKNHLSAFNEFEVIAECNNALEAMTIISKQKIDLLFCDIQMPQITGIDFIRSLQYAPKVIFTTAYRDYAIEAFELNVVDYLLKPISFERFAKAINIFMENECKKTDSIDQTEFSKKQDYIFLKADKKHHKVNLDDILYFESFGDYINVYKTSGKITVKERIGNLENILPEKYFLRIHRGYIVSIQKIKSIGPGFVEIEKNKLPIGRQHKSKIMKFVELKNLIAYNS